MSTSIAHRRPVVKALVAARAGSERVLSKNTRPFAGTTLLENKLRQLRRLTSLDGVVVSSESREILEAAERLGCETAVRPARFASSDALMSDVYEYMATACGADVIVYANCTSPLIRDETIEDFVRSFGAPGAAFDSVNSASRVREFMFLEDRPINYDLAHQPRSQDLPEILSLNFAVNVIARQTMIERKNVVGFRPTLRVTSEIESVDIDTEVDFDFAEHLFTRLGGVEYLMS